jgi:hypothetical protein
MENILDDGASWLADQLADHVQRSVRFIRRAVISDEVFGTPQLQQYEVLDDGVPTTVTIWDWIFRTADLPWELLPGDRFQETRRGVVINYEVRPLDKTPCTQELDTAGLMTVVHSKKVRDV